MSSKGISKLAEYYSNKTKTWLDRCCELAVEAFEKESNYGNCHFPISSKFSKTEIQKILDEHGLARNVHYILNGDDLIFRNPKIG